MTLLSVLDIVISSFCIAYSIASRSSFSQFLVDSSRQDSIGWKSYLGMILHELSPLGPQVVLEPGPATCTHWIAKIQQLEVFISPSFELSVCSASGKRQLGDEGQ